MATVRVAIVGAGNVGQSIARALLAGGRHKVLIIERNWQHYRPELVPDADWMYADGCEVSALHAAGIATAHVAIAATGDDKVNLVFALLSKTQFGVPRVVARVNEPGNHWLFDSAWGVDVAVSTPVRLAAAIDEALVTGEVVRLMSLQHGTGSIVEFTLPADSSLIGRPLGSLPLPADAVLLAVYREREVRPADRELALAAGDELVYLVGSEGEQRLRDRLRQPG